MPAAARALEPPRRGPSPRRVGAGQPPERLLAPALAACVALAPLSDGRAAELWKSGEDGLALEGTAFYKPYAAWLGLPRGLVDQTVALDRLFDEARAQLPPEAAAELPARTALPSQLGLSAHTVRVAAKALYGERLELATAWQASALIASAPEATGGVGAGNLLGRGDVAAQRRLVDFAPVLVEAPGLRLTHNLDQLSLRFRTSRATLVVGRQVLSFGTGRLWNPTDLLSPFSPTDVDREVRRGVDAARIFVPLGATSQLEVLWLPQKAAADNGGVLRAQTNLAGYDLSVSFAKYARDLVAGADFSGDAGPLGVHGESAFTWQLDGLSSGLSHASVSDRFLRAVLGIDWRPAEAWVLMAEYYFNGYGAAAADGYAQKLGSDRLARGEVFGAGRHYGGLMVAFSPYELLSVQATALVNLQDPSALGVLSLEHWFEQSVLMRVGGYLPVGRRPDPSAVRSLTVRDLLDRSDAFMAATSTLGLQSEYGASAWGVFAQVGLYFQ